MGKAVSVSRDTHMAGFEALRTKIRALDTQRVEVGVPSGPTYPDGTSVAQVFAWNEFGTERIPERPALRTGIKRALPGIKRLNTANLRMVIDGRMSAGIALAQMGLYAEGEVKRAILSGPWAPNAPRTIARKKSDKPLVDTNQMVQSVVSRVVPA
jgi:hypothetical protein